MLPWIDRAIGVDLVTRMAEWTSPAIGLSLLIWVAAVLAGIGKHGAGWRWLLIAEFGIIGLHVIGAIPYVS